MHPPTTVASGPHVLVVEDDPHQRELLELFLKARGCVATLVGDGAEAFAAIQRSGARMPDIIVTDLRMPRMDGLELVHAVRTAGFMTPMILHSAHTTDDPRIREFARMPRTTIVPKGKLAALTEAIGRLMQPELE